MNARLKIATVCASVALAVAPLTGCYQMGDVQDIAACQAFAAAQTSYDKTGNESLAAPGDRAKQVAWAGAWLILIPGIKAAAAIPNTASLKTALEEYSTAIEKAGIGASASTQIEIWKKGYASSIVKICKELAAPVDVTDLEVK